MPCGHASGRGRGRLGWGRGGSRVGQSALFQEILAGRNHTAAALAMLCVRGDLAVAMRTFHDAKAFTVSSTKEYACLIGSFVSPKDSGRVDIVRSGEILASYGAC